ncbi:hypothetical protein GCM10027413_31970 [Conyzicola nivalis]|uniref:Type VII secretion integral membrane protein EccD n=1 Tax=Conyzicola nivalis TaxID=1477021 RepID=A0A916SQL6_9MICO|nr:hypothetical protein [Conyzicola nivalis]GGB11727.1 hypothetical protein GCM10010979_27550 [Conyzicola nivalis]
MLLTAPERRKIVVLSGDRRVDAAVPFDDSLRSALLALGYTLEAGRHAVLDRTGAEADLDAPGSELQDGSMFSIVDLLAPARERASGAAATDSARDDKRALWWLIGTFAIVLAAVALVDAAGDGTLSYGLARVGTGLVLVAGAVASAVFWAMRGPRNATAESLAMIAPLALAFSAGVLLIDPALEASVHLAVVTGLFAAGVLATLLAAAVEPLRLRSAAATAAVVLLALGAVWGATLLAGLDSAAAAAISAGAVPLALRYLPSTLVNVPEGHHIDYKHFMSSRWTVRGEVPESPDAIEPAEVRNAVDASSARLVTGVVLLSIIAAVSLPIAIAAPLPEGGFVFGGAIALVAALTIALLLSPRHYATPVLRWVPRAACGVVVLVAAIAVSTMFGDLVVLVVAAGLLVTGIVAAVLLVPIGRGARSLAWSRLADVLEWLAVALSLPAGLLAADVLTAVRGMMST